MDEAEKLEMQVMKSRKEMLGPTHPDTLIAINNLGITYISQGPEKEASELRAEISVTCSFRVRFVPLLISL